MKTIELQKDKIYCGNLLIVNAEYPLRNKIEESLIPADMHIIAETAEKTYIFIDNIID